MCALAPQYGTRPKPNPPKSRAASMSQKTCAKFGLSASKGLWRAASRKAAVRLNSGAHSVSTVRQSQTPPATNPATLSMINPNIPLSLDARFGIRPVASLTAGTDRNISKARERISTGPMSPDMTKPARQSRPMPVVQISPRTNRLLLESHSPKR